MKVSREQLEKLFEIAGISCPVNISDEDITNALVKIERLVSFLTFDELEENGKSVLLVDDLELSAGTYEKCLSKSGFSVSISRTPEEAFAKICERKYDAVIVDLFLPELKDGLRLIEKIAAKRAEYDKNRKIIAISPLKDRHVIKSAYDFGADICLVKGADHFNELLKSLGESSSEFSGKFFHKKSLNESTCLYSFRRFNDKTIFDALLADIKLSVASSVVNIVLNFENILNFEDDNAYVFAEIYRICNSAGGSCLLLRPSERIKEVLASAYLEGAFPAFDNESAITEFLENKNTNA